MIVIIMGVSGSGKTEIGSLLAKKLGWKFLEGDEYHPKANIDKMSNGIPLEDHDRIGWLYSLAKEIGCYIERSENAVLACSALKEKYRKILVINSNVNLIYLKGPIELIRSRLKIRRNHFMKENLLESQFGDLEEPQDALAVDISQRQELIVNEICQKLKL